MCVINGIFSNDSWLMKTKKGKEKEREKMGGGGVRVGGDSVDSLM